MPEVLRPDMKAVVWLAIGFLVVPMLQKYIPFMTGGKE